MQWIYRNFTLHEKLCGYLHKKNLEDIRLTIEELADTAPEEVPEESKFLLEITFGNLTKSHIENQQYWVIAIQVGQAVGLSISGTRSILKFPAGQNLESQW